MFRHIFACVIAAGAIGTTALSGPVALASPAVQSTTCDANLQLGFNPGLKLGESAQTIKIFGTLSNCAGGGVTQAIIQKGTGAGTMSCTSGSASATITLRWNTGERTQVMVTVDPSGVITGTVNRGKFAGEDVSADLAVTPTQGDCFFQPVTRATATGSVSL
jgi:hypothetical protein